MNAAERERKAYWANFYAGLLGAPQTSATRKRRAKPKPKVQRRERHATGRRKPATKSAPQRSRGTPPALPSASSQSFHAAHRGVAVKKPKVGGNTATPDSNPPVPRERPNGEPPVFSNPIERPTATVEWEPGAFEAATRPPRLVGVRELAAAAPVVAPPPVPAVARARARSGTGGHFVKPRDERDWVEFELHRVTFLCGHPYSPENVFNRLKDGKTSPACRACALQAERDALEATRRFRKQCTAVDAGTGLRCGLLEHDGKVHRTPRGPFTSTLAPGATSRRSLELAYRATAGRAP